MMYSSFIRSSNKTMLSFVFLFLLNHYILASDHSKREDQKVDELRTESCLKEKKFFKEKKFSGPITYLARTGTGICQQELSFLSKRLTQTASYLSSLTNNDQSVNHTPIIAALGSGGGFRAMISFLGFLEGLEAIGVFDGLTYCAGVSGSTWLLASLYAHQKYPQAHHSFLQQQLNQKFTLDQESVELLIKNIKEKLSNHQKLTFCDIWGALISRSIFGDLRDKGQTIRLEELAPFVDNGQMPLPICTAVLDHYPSYEWVEFSPYEVGSDYLSCWVPTNCFGKKFDNGISNDIRPGASLSYLVGLFGSAYALTLPELINYLYLLILDSFRKNIEENRAFYNSIELVENLRFSPPMIRNITRNLFDYPCNNNHYQVLVDAGLDCNLPFVPALKRKANLILCCDSSMGIKQNERFGELKKVEEYARSHNIPFPTIDYKNINKKELSVFIDQLNPEAPIVLYFPCQKEFPTLKFEYTEQEFEELSQSMKQAVLNNALTIYEAINTAYLRQKELYKKNKIENSVPK